MSKNQKSLFTCDLEESFGYNKYGQLRPLTNKEAAGILKSILDNAVAKQGRSNGKSLTFFRHCEAMVKAIKLLEETEDL